MAMRRAGCNDGFVLLIVLVYLQVLVLLGVVVLEVIERDIRKNFTGLQMQRMEVLAEEVLGLMEDGDVSRCVVQPMSAVLLREMPIRWWKGAACRTAQDKFEYYFIRERLGNSRSAVKNKTNKQYIKPIIYRNTLLYVSALTASRYILLQSVTRNHKRLSLRRLW